jgi:nickel-type superoxide dismutase maturation protease
MLRILKITGNSMSPDFNEGDFVVVATLPFVLRRVRPGDVIVFEHGLYGTLIKRISAIENDGIVVTGTREDSLDSRRLGPIDPARVGGKVLLHIRKKV